MPAAHRLILRSMRPRQWVKNALVAAPLVFGGKAADPAAAGLALLAVLLFCLLSGGVYLFNDVLDRKKDREHPLKKDRPIASGRLPAGTATAAGAAAVAAGLAGAAAVSPLFTAVLGAYLLISLAYSRFLKHLVIIDVMTLAAGFLLRVVAGAVAVNVEISSWLLICTALLALFLAFGKRRHELILLEVNASSHRPILTEYSPYFLDQMISVVTTSTLVTYTLYTMSPAVQAKLGTESLGLTIPFVLYGIFRYLYLIHQKQAGGDPTETIVTDLPLIVDVLLWGAAVGIILYAG